MRPICIDRIPALELNDTHLAPALTRLEIVPWRPAKDVIALQIWPEVVAARCKPVAKSASPVLILAEDGVVKESVLADGVGDGPSSGLAIQTEQIRPSPVVGMGWKESMARKKRKSMSLPDAVSNSDTRTLLV